MTGRKSSATGKLKGNKEKAAKCWYNLFSSLLGEAPNIEDEDEELKQYY